MNREFKKRKVETATKKSMRRNLEAETMFFGSTFHHGREEQQKGEGGWEELAKAHKGDEKPCFSIIEVGWRGGSIAKGFNATPRNP